MGINHQNNDVIQNFSFCMFFCGIWRVAADDISCLKTKCRFAKVWKNTHADFDNVQNRLECLHVGKIWSTNTRLKTWSTISKCLLVQYMPLIKWIFVLKSQCFKILISLQKWDWVQFLPVWLCEHWSSSLVCFRLWSCHCRNWDVW